jgi:hypothetical protein
MCHPLFQPQCILEGLAFTAREKVEYQSSKNALRLEKRATRLYTFYEVGEW